MWVCFLAAASQQPETCRAGTLGERQQSFPAPQNAFFLHQSQFGACHGRIRALRFRAYHGNSPQQSSTVIYVSFWRPSGHTGVYTAIGRAAISSSTTTTANGYFEYNAMSDNITVQPGDRMGVWMEGPTLRLLYATPFNSLSLYMPLSPGVRAAALGTADHSVFFRPPSSRETAVMEVEVLLPTGGTVTTPVPSITVDSSSLVPSTSNSFDHSSSTTLSSSTSNPPLVSSTVLPIYTSVLPAPSSSASVTERPLPATTTHIAATTTHIAASTTRRPPPPSSVPLLPSSTATTGAQEGVGEFPFIPVAAGAAGGLLLVLLLLCVCVVLSVLLRQWKVKGRPFKGPRNGGMQCTNLSTACIHIRTLIKCALIRSYGNIFSIISTFRISILCVWLLSLMHHFLLLSLPVACHFLLLCYFLLLCLLFMYRSSSLCCSGLCGGSHQ